ncbi:MAG TPA: alpha/beta fold hydrolase [Candidatus Binatia bacterium]|jgi:pimeloyl-ACP methyl ester carboxylesterase|nr:alpha/beta fold hydrolase [Candidatus Binatia bacterium]
MNLLKESVRFRSLGDEMAGTLFLPASGGPAPVLIVCHGAGEFKENYFEMCERLAERSLASLAIDMHGHGQSGGERFYVDMRQWVADIQGAIDFVLTRPELDGGRIGAFGLSSGGTAVLEAGIVEPRLKVLVGLDATVRNSLPRIESFVLKSLVQVGQLKRRLTKRDFRVPLAKFSVGPKMASDPEINRRLLSDPHALEAFMALPLPGAEQAFFVDTLTRVSRITAPTLVLWGEDDKLDPPETGRLLCDALTCKKQLEVIPGNGHVGHLDRNRAKVFALTADWVLGNLGNGSAGNNGSGASNGTAAKNGSWGTNGSAGNNGSMAARSSSSVRTNAAKVIEGEAAKQLGRHEKWQLLSPFLRQHGAASLAYATLQDGMEYFIDETGYIAFTTVRHPVLSPRPRRITLSDPVCAVADRPRLIERFLADNPRASFGVITEACAEALHGMGFKVNCIGYEPEIAIQTYNTQGNWKELDLIKRARNEAKREGLTIREEEGASLKKDDLAAVSARWIGSKKINDREIWLYARRPIFDHEEDVRKFVAYDREGKAAGFAFYDPMYRDGKVYGYSANIVRCDEKRYGRLATAVHMEAIEKFRTEGREVFNLLLAPFVKLELGKYNDDFGAKLFFQLSARFGNDIYNFKGLSFHKSKYRGVEKPMYVASKSLMMSNELYLAFVSADIARSYFATLGQLLRGMISAAKNGKSD